MRFFRLQTLGNLNDSELCLTGGPPESMEMRSYCMARGKRATPFYPTDAKVSLLQDRPGSKLSSLLGNTDRYLIVHTDMKEVIAAHCQGLEVEYLPFDLYDHRKRLYSRDYFFINPIGTHDCLDPIASGVKVGSQEGVIHVARYVLDPKRSTHLPPLFRPKEEPSVYIVAEPLAQALREKGFTNVYLEPLAFSTST